MLPCPSCGAEVPGGFAFCGRCGAPVGPGPGTEDVRALLEATARPSAGPGGGRRGGPPC